MIALPELKDELTMYIRGYRIISVVKTNKPVLSILNKRSDDELFIETVLTISCSH